MYKFFIWRVLGYHVFSIDFVDKRRLSFFILCFMMVPSSYLKDLIYFVPCNRSNFYFVIIPRSRLRQTAGIYKLLIHFYVEYWITFLKNVTQCHFIKIKHYWPFYYNFFGLLKINIWVHKLKSSVHIVGIFHYSARLIKNYKEPERS